MFYENNNDLLKDDVVHTPKELSQFIYKQVFRKGYKNIIDVGAYNGILSQPFSKKSNTTITAIDVINDYSANFNHFIHKDYLETTRDDYIKSDEPKLILMNPPFSQLSPIKFIRHTLDLFGADTPIIAIVPNYILDNSKNRGQELNSINITRTITLDRAIYKKENDVVIHTSLLFINIQFKKKAKAYEYWSAPKEAPNKVKYRTTYFSADEEIELQKILKANKMTYSKYIKSLIFDR